MICLLNTCTIRHHLHGIHPSDDIFFVLLYATESIQHIEARYCKESNSHSEKQATLKCNYVYNTFSNLYFVDSISHALLVSKLQFVTGLYTWNGVKLSAFCNIRKVLPGILSYSCSTLITVL